MPRYDNVTFMMCLPRSRSAWLANFLKPVAHTMHDPLKQCASISELAAKVDAALEANPERPVFIADTAACFFADRVFGTFPDAKYLFVERPLAEVKASARAQGSALPPSMWDLMSEGLTRAKLVSSARSDLTLVVRYDEIDRRLLNIWRFVGDGSLLSRAYADAAITRNIQIPFSEQRKNTDRHKVRRLFASIGIHL